MRLLLYVTAPDMETGRRLARLLVEKRLAAGVNIVPGVLSVYRWRGAVREHGECLLLAQIAEAAFEDARALLAREHPYEVPCVTAVPLRRGHAPFLRWIDDNSLPADDERRGPRNLKISNGDNPQREE